MPDWLTLRLFLIVAPVAMLLAASALAAGERRAKARRARDALGRPMSRVEEGTAGERVLLEGQLEVLEGPCARFEDGEPAAAATVEASGAHAIPDGVRPHFADGKEPFVARSARASEVVLAVGPERVALTGPLDVYIGSSEMDPGAPFGSLDPAVRERVALVAGADALPHPGAIGPVLGRPLFRSVQSGDRVRAAGVLVKRSEGDRTGYRDRAGWALSGDEASPVVIAYAATPRFRGAVTAFARGVRRVERLRAALAATVIFGALATLAALQANREARPPAPLGPPVPAQAAQPHHHLADPVECESLKKEHAAAVAKLARCTADADCSVEARAGAVFDLEGCYRFSNRKLSADEAARIQEKWMALGCATSYEICPSPPLAMCQEGRCVERPPPPIPETWHREDAPGAFSLYLPPETKRTGPLPSDSVVTVFRGGGLELTTDFGPWSADEDERIGKPATMKIGGYDAKVWKLPREITVYFDDERDCAPPRCPFFGQERSLTLRARCDTEGACDDAWLALRSVQFW